MTWPTRCACGAGTGIKGGLRQFPAYQGQDNARKRDFESWFRFCEIRCRHTGVIVYVEEAPVTCPSQGRPIILSPPRTSFRMPEENRVVVVGSKLRRSKWPWRAAYDRIIARQAGLQARNATWLVNQAGRGIINPSSQTAPFNSKYAARHWPLLLVWLDTNSERGFFF